MRNLSFRLTAGELLKERIEQAIKEHKIKAGFVASIVGSLDVAVLRLAGSSHDDQKVETFPGPWEIISGTGTLSVNGCHIHIALSDKEGKVIGGHLKDGCIVAYTCEVILAILEDTEFTRSPDAQTGFDELIISYED